MQRTPNTFLPKRLNYLHYGDSLDRLTDSLDSLDSRIPKDPFISQLSVGGATARHLEHVVGRFGSKRQRGVKVANLRRAVASSVRARSSFTRLDCRGFSYQFSTRPSGFPVRLRKAVNARVAIFVDTRLNYPPAVLKFFGHARGSHFYDSHGPAIAFALGMWRSNSLYLVTLQSDWSYNSPSAVREHFRGWRRVLLTLIRDHLKPRGLFLAKSKDVLRGCHNGFEQPSEVPKSWRDIYELSAKETGMKPVQLSRGVNIQLYANHPSVIARDFYSLRLENSP